MIEFFVLLLLTSPFLILGWLIFSVVVGAVAAEKNRSFFGWFLLSLLVTPLFAILALIAVPARKDIADMRPNELAAALNGVRNRRIAMACVIMLLIGYGAYKAATFVPSSGSTVEPASVSTTVPLPRPRPL